MVCPRRTLAISLFCFSRLLLAQSAPAPANPLDKLDETFLKSYVARTEIVRATAPPFIEVSGGNLLLHLHGHDPLKARVLTDLYDHLKDVSHIPFTIYLLLSGRENTQVPDDQLIALRNFQKALATAREALPSQGFNPVQLERQRQIVDESTRLIDAVLQTGKADPGTLKSYAQAMAPLMLRNADDAGCLQVQATHKQILAWKPLFTQQDWNDLHAVIKSSHQPRYREVSTQYFGWLLGGSSPAWALPGETDRVIYAEAMFSRQTPEDELLDLLVDFEASRFFFGNQWRLSEDVLSDGAARCIANLPVDDRAFHPNFQSPR